MESLCEDWPEGQRNPKDTRNAAEKDIIAKKTQGLLLGIKNGDTGKTPEKKSSTPDRSKRPEGTKKLEPEGVKPVTERLQPDEEDESTEETSGETLGSDSETTASSDSGDGTEQSTLPYKQDDSTPESEKVRKKFGGRIVEKEHESLGDGEAAPDLNPLLGALEDAGEMQWVEYMTEGTEYLEDSEPAQVVVKESAPSLFKPRKQPVQRAVSRLGVPQLTTVATKELDEQTGQDEAQLDTIMEEGQIEIEQTGWESVEALPSRIRKNTKDMRISTTVNQAVISVVHQLEERIQINENAIRESAKEQAAAKKAAPIGMKSGGSPVTQAQSRTTTGLLIQMETLNPNQSRSAPAASVPVTLQGHPILTKASSSANPVVHGRIALPPVITSGLASNLVVTNIQITAPIT
ncbi:hypothetical protein R1sor_007072 [Riccia sorocarpa]|uniref:Uncharacterized protein n=1 Tax=Riccia sorocarpa TaxID=122646 RepID=A0ABD3HR60_9MARC